MFAQTRGIDAGEIARGNDLVGVDVCARDRKHAAAHDHAVTGTFAASSAGEAMCPRIALAATTCGEARCTRPPSPMRPGKFRFVDEMQRAPGASTPIDI